MTNGILAIQWARQRQTSISVFEVGDYIHIWVTHGVSWICPVRCPIGQQDESSVSLLTTNTVYNVLQFAFFVLIHVWCSLISVGSKLTTTTITSITISMICNIPRYTNTSVQLALSKYLPCLTTNQVLKPLDHIKLMWHIFNYVCNYPPPKDVSLFGPSLWLPDLTFYYGTICHHVHIPN